MGKSNSKSEINYSKFGRRKSHSSRGDLNIGVVHNKPKANDLQTIIIPNSNDDILRTGTIKSKIRDRQIVAERLKYEIDARARLEEHNDRMIREKQRKIVDESEMKKQHDLVQKQQANKTENITKNEEINERRHLRLKIDNNFEPHEDHHGNVTHIGEQSEKIRKENNSLKGGKNTERQLLENLLNIELAKKECAINQNSKTYNQQQKSIKNESKLVKITDFESHTGETNIEYTKQLPGKVYDGKDKIFKERRHLPKNGNTPNTSTQACCCTVNKNHCYNEPPPPYSSEQYSYQPNKLMGQPPPAYSPRDICLPKQSTETADNYKKPKPTGTYINDNNKKKVFEQE